MFIVDVDLSQMAGNQKYKGTLLSQTVKDGEKKNDTVNISACGHATDLVQYSTDSSCNEDSKTYWNMSVSGLWAELYK